MRYVFYLICLLLIIQKSFSADDFVDLSHTPSSHKNATMAPSSPDSPSDLSETRRLALEVQTLRQENATSKQEISTLKQELVRYQKRQDTFERLLTNKTEAPVEFMRRIPADKILMAAIVIGIVGTILYLISPQFNAFNVLLSNIYTTYVILKLVRELGTVAVNTPMIRNLKGA